MGRGGDTSVSLSFTLVPHKHCNHEWIQRLKKIEQSRDLYVCILWSADCFNRVLAEGSDTEFIQHALNSGLMWFRNAR